METKIRDGLTAVVSVDMDKVLRKRAQSFGVLGRTMHHIQRGLRFRDESMAVHGFDKVQHAALKALISEIDAHEETSK